MTCQEFKELAASLALGSLDAEERAACEAHLLEAQHEGCPEVLAQAEETVDAIPLALPPVKPSPELWKRIAGRLDVDGARPPAPIVRRGAPWTLTAVGWMAAAAAVAGILHFRERGMVARERVGVAEQAVLASTQGLERCTRDLEVLRAEHDAQAQAIALLEAPAAVRVIPLAPQAGATQRATALLDADGRRAVIIGSGLAPQPGKDYELWVIKGEAKLAAGLLRAGDDGRITWEVKPGALSQGIDAFAITLEPEGGGEAPRGPILLVGVVGKG